MFFLVLFMYVYQVESCAVNCAWIHLRISWFHTDLLVIMAAVFNFALQGLWLAPEEIKVQSAQA